MVSLQKAEELIAQKKYTNAKEILKQSLEEEESFSGELYLKLLSLYEIDQDHNFSEILNLGIEKFKESKDYKNLLSTLLIKKKYKTLLIKEELILLECLWDQGEVEKFIITAKEINEKLLTEKYLSHYQEFLDKVESYSKDHIFIYLGKLNYLLLNAQYTEVIKHLNELNSFYSRIKKNSKVQNLYDVLIDKILSTIEDYKENDATLYTEYLYYLAISSREKSKLDMKEAIEYLLLKQDSAKYLLELMYLDIPTDLKFEIVSLIKSRKDYSFKEVKKHDVEIRKMFLTNIFAGKREIVEKEKTLSDIDKYLETLKEYDQPTEQEDKVKEYEVSKEEKDFIVRINIRDKEIIGRIDEWVIAFIELDFFRAARDLLDKAEDLVKYDYLKASIHYSCSEYIECIESVNHYFNRKIEEDGKEAFYYLKGEAYLKMKRNSDAYAAFREVLKINPNYRSVKEKLGLCKE